MNYTSYENRTIAEIIAKLNSEYFIPAIQRPYVWEVEQIEKLFDSIMKEYPISTFLLWKPPTENKGNWHTYRFAQHFKYGEIHNEEADLTQAPEVHLVLDGQQRLTSLFIGLAGSYQVRQKYKRKRIESSYVHQSLFLNLLKNPDDAEDNDEVEGVTYGFQFVEPAKVKNTQSEYWFSVSDILAMDTSDKLEDRIDLLVDELDLLKVDLDQKKIARRNLKCLYRVIWEHRTISACIVKQPSYDKVLDIFVRANDGGTKLSKSDLLMSLVTLNWRNHDARDELVGFLNEINDDLTTKNNFDRDFLLRSALLFCGQKYVFKVDSFTKENLLQIEDSWPMVKKAVRRAVQLVNSFGISNYKGNLSSNNSVMPIAYYIFQLLKKYQSDEVVESITDKNKSAIRTWLVTALFSGVFAGAADSTVVKATKIVRERIAYEDTFPAREIAENLSHRRKNALFDNERVEEFLSLSGADRVLTICLQLLYPLNDWEQNIRYRRFVFPPDEIATDGLSIERRDDLLEDAQRIANMVLLGQDEHDELKALGWEEWLVTRTPVERAWHLLPGPNDCDFDDFLSFIGARKLIIQEKLGAIFPEAQKNNSQNKDLVM